MNEQDRAKLTDLRKQELKIRLENSIKNIEQAIRCVMDVDYLFISQYDDRLHAVLHLLGTKRKELDELRERDYNKDEKNIQK